MKTKECELCGAIFEPEYAKQSNCFDCEQENGDPVGQWPCELAVNAAGDCYSDADPSL